MSLLIRLTGSESEIAYTLAALKAQGYEWEGNNRRYPQRDNPRRFSCYLNDVIAPPLIQAAPGHNDELHSVCGTPCLAARTRANDR